MRCKVCAWQDCSDEDCLYEDWFYSVEDEWWHGTQPEGGFEYGDQEVEAERGGF